MPGQNRSGSKFTAALFKKPASLTSSAVSTVGSMDLKSSSPVRVSPRNFKYKQSETIEKPEGLPVSLKALQKRYSWLKLLKPHQRRGAKQSISENGFALLFAQRTGKTWITGASLLLADDHDVLLVGPKTNLSSTWEKFFTEKLPQYTICRSIDEYRQFIKDWKAQWGDTPRHVVLLMNYEAVVPILGKLRRIKWDRIVYDEAQRLKNRNSRSSKDAHLLSGSATRRLALSGTPMDLSSKDLWAIMRFVEPKVFGTRWKDFEDHFIDKPIFDNTKRGIIARRQEQMRFNIAKRKAPMRKDREDQFAELISPHVMRVSKEEAGIKAAEIIRRKFDLTGKQLKQYEKLERHMVIKHKGVVIRAPLKIVQMGKLQQITGGHIKDELGETHKIGDCKINELEDAIKHYTKKKEPFVVFCKYVWEVHLIAKLLRRMGYKRVAKLWGKVKDLKRDKRRTDMLLGFQLGEFQAMVCQQRTGGVGVDLYRARKFFVYSMGHSFIDFDQMLSRGDFLEQIEPATFIFLEARRTIDTDIHNSVRRKKSITELFYDRLTKG